jgi:hypothetical protein
MIEIHRHEQNGILQGFSFYAYPDPIAIVVHESGLWHEKIMYQGWGSFGAINQNLEVSGFQTMQEADQFIADNGLIYSGTHIWQSMEGLIIYEDNPEAEEKPIMVSGGKIIQPDQSTGVKLVWGEPEKVIDYIMQENYDISELPEWSTLIGIEVKRNTWCQYNGKPYVSTTTHTVQSDWNPEIAFSLWFTRYPDGIVGDWKQPLGAHDAYKLDMKVRHTGWIWIATVDNNVWEPGVFGWQQVSQLEPPVEPPVDPPANPCDGIAAWDINQHWSTYSVGDRRKDGGKAWECHTPAWAQSYAPSSQWGYLGWTYLFDCP